MIFVVWKSQEEKQKKKKTVENYIYLPFKQNLFRLNTSRVSLRRGGPCTSRLIKIGTSCDMLPAHGK